MPISGGVFKSLFKQLLSALLINRFLATHAPKRRRRPPTVTAFELVLGLVFHVVAGSGTLAQHVKKVTGKTITDGALSQRRAEIPMEVFDALMTAALRPKANDKEHPHAF